ncbi:MAG: S-adenosylmethionine:tRNA ribosyltransferase-isomerase [Chloroflexia bacterium]
MAGVVLPDRLRDGGGQRRDAVRGRAFTPELLTKLVARGVRIAPLLLHTGVASLGGPRAAVRGVLPRADRDRAGGKRGQPGGRVVAVGTTVVRALETVADEHDVAHPGEGWTRLLVVPERACAWWTGC